MFISDETVASLKYIIFSNDIDEAEFDSQMHTKGRCERC